MGGGGAREPAVELGQRLPGPYRGQGGGERTPGWGGVVDVVGGHNVEAPGDRQMGEGVVAGRVERVAVVPELHDHVLGSEDLDEPVELAARRGRARGGEGGGDRTLATPRQDDPVPAVAVAALAGQVFE